MSRRIRAQLTVAPPSSPDHSQVFSGLCGLEFLPSDCSRYFNLRFYCVWGCFSPFFLRPARTLSVLCRTRVWLFTPLSEARDCQFFDFVQFRPAEALLTPEPGGDKGILFAHNATQGYIRDYVLFRFFVLFVLLISGNHSSPLRGCRWCHLPFRVFAVY